MYTHPIIEQLKKMKLFGMSKALMEQFEDASSQTLSFEERLSFLVDREFAYSENRRLQSRLKQSKLRFLQATMVDIDYRPERQLDKKLIATLSAGDWLRHHKNILITGATGSGKSWLACALANKACLLGFRAQYWRLSRLLEELDLYHADGRYLNLIKKISKINLLVLDDFGMTKLQGRHQQDILEILEDRYEQHSVIVTSQLPVSNWHEQITDPTFADAILDRLVGGSYQVPLKGKSLRGKKIDNNPNKVEENVVTTDGSGT